MNYYLLVSNIFGYLSIFCWFIVLVPQIHLNYKRKSCQGVSLLFYLMWSLGDLFNLTGAVMENLILTAIILPLYYIVADCVVLSQFYIYRNNSRTEEQTPLLEESTNKPTNTAGCWRVVGWTVTLIAVALCLSSILLWSMDIPLADIDWQRIVAQSCGYLSAAVYLGAYVPQILRNYRSKSTEGLSMMMFILVVVANLTYCLSVLSAQPPSLEYLMKYASWLLGASGTIWLELAILYQFYLYRS